MRIIFVLLFLFLSIYLASEDLIKLEYESLEYEPEKFRTGDSVFCRIKVSGMPFNSDDAAGVKAEKSISFEITDIKINISSGEILVWFIPFNPEEKYLPVIRSRSFLLEKVPVEIDGYYSPGDSFPEPPGAVLLPGTRIFLGFIFFIVSLFIFFGYYFARYFYKPVKGGIFAIFREMEIRKILSLLKSLNRGISGKDPVNLCMELSTLFRNYLEKRTSSSFMPLTSREISGKLLVSGWIDLAEAEKLGKTLYLLDRIRFSSRNTTSEAKLSGIVENIISTVDSVEAVSGKKEASGGN